LQPDISSWWARLSSSTLMPNCFADTSYVSPFIKLKVKVSFPFSSLIFSIALSKVKKVLSTSSIMVFHKKKKFQGQIFAFYLMWYGAGRAVIEGLRTDSMLLFGLRLNQLIGIAIVIIGLVIMVCGYLKAKKNIDVVALAIKRIKGAFKKKSKKNARTSKKNEKSIDKTESSHGDKEE